MELSSEKMHEQPARLRQLESVLGAGCRVSRGVIGDFERIIEVQGSTDPAVLLQSPMIS